MRASPLIRAHRQVGAELVIATHNPGKLAELRDLLAPFGITAVAAGELGLAEPAETGASFRDNARIKAEAAAAAAGRVAFADDSGLAVDALAGAPGIHSARWAGAQKDFAAAMQRIENELAARDCVEPSQRRAHFVCALCLAWPDRHVEEFEGRVDGTLVWPPRGRAGFGYDPMFLPDGHSRTFGEMTSTEKHGLPPSALHVLVGKPESTPAGAGAGFFPGHALGTGLSHRARAFRQLAEACLAPR
jgi:XTP/dITP diphosphohydrolase